ncbi:hypothetical protein P7K49_034523 [Saguinus oedipus]|uniref:Uncharacterized protein n=1 Tax=Saguinus oedipus TaxID=9490 RepID=A0ABQ9TUZ2_SAGOE|nr:hypothetical protein P7K49_034523 [Saguinus oedipus]
MVTATPHTLIKNTLTMLLWTTSSSRLQVEVPGGQTPGSLGKRALGARIQDSGRLQLPLAELKHWNLDDNSPTKRLTKAPNRPKPPTYPSHIRSREDVKGKGADTARGPTIETEFEGEPGLLWAPSRKLGIKAAEPRFMPIPPYCRATPEGNWEPVL